MSEKKDDVREKKMDEDIPRFAEAKKKIQEIRENTVKTVNKSIDDIKEAARKPHDQDFNKTMAYIRDNAQKAVESAKIKIDEIKNDPKVQSGFAEMQAKGKDAVDKTKSYIDSKLTDKQKADLKETRDKASEVLNNTARKTAQAVDEFVNKPEVQEFNRKANETVEKGVNKVKDFFNKKD
jgi:ElaB/YqjD/DUF883 family membrane-anchored ribosome-binding protein